MSATNHTQNYDLSQFVGGDIPSWLGDYNGDMSKIDTAIANVASGAGDIASDVNNLKSRMTTAEADIDAAESNIATLQTTSSTQGAAITQNTNNIATTNNNVSALDARVTALEQGGPGIDFDLTAHTGNATLTPASGVALDSVTDRIIFKYAINDDYSIGKIYGGVQCTKTSGLSQGWNTLFSTNAICPTIDAAYDVEIGYQITTRVMNSTESSYPLQTKLHFNTDGTIDVQCFMHETTSYDYYIYCAFPPCVYFLKDFGD